MTKFGQYFNGNSRENDHKCCQRAAKSAKNKIRSSHFAGGAAKFGQKCQMFTFLTGVYQGYGRIYTANPQAAIGTAETHMPY